LIVFDAAVISEPLTDYLTQQWARGVTLREVKSVTINGLDAVTARAAVTTSRGPTEMMLAVIRATPPRVYRFRAEIPPALLKSLAPEIERTVMSFMLLSDRDAAAIKERRVTIVRAGEAETVEYLARRCAFENYRVERFRVLNGLGSAEALKPSQLVKIVTDLGDTSTIR
jgi:predicted Zn-dependent protease